MVAPALYRRILLKLSGESLGAEGGFGFHPEALSTITEEIAFVHEQHLEIGIVLGAGNLFRGSQRKSLGMRRVPADNMGMLSSVVNALALQESLALAGCKSQILTPFSCGPFAQEYSWQLANDLLAQGYLLLFAGGTGSPFFTTDSNGALRACEMQADVLLKATKVDGVYDKDPKKHSDAMKYHRLTYSQILSERLAIMDATAAVLLMEENIPTIVFNLFEKGNLWNALSKPHTGTFIHNE